MPLTRVFNEPMINVVVAAGHKDVKTTMVYIHVVNRGRGVRTPLDNLRRVVSSGSGGIIWTSRSAQNSEQVLEPVGTCVESKVWKK